MRSTEKNTVLKKGMKFVFLKLQNAFQRLVEKPKEYNDIAKQCDKEIVKINRIRLKIGATVVLFAEIAILFTFALDYFSTLNTDVLPNIIANAVFTFVLICALVLTTLIKNDRFFNVVVCFFAYFTIVFSVSLSYIDSHVKAASDIASYLMVLLIVAAALTHRPHVFMLTQLLVLVPMFVLFQTSSSFEMKITDFTNIGIANLFAAFVAYYGYNTTYKSIGNKIRIDHQKELLLSQAEVDALTQLYNRRKLNELLDSEWKRAIRVETGMSMILIDIDCFKNYNDTYGHLEGDECLIKVAGALKNHFKRADEFVARYGGEEFVVVMANSNLEKGVAACERALKAVRDLNIPHIKSTVAEHVTVSAFTDSLLEFINKTDMALYSAKANGRNRFSIAGEAVFMYGYQGAPKDTNEPCETCGHRLKNFIRHYCIICITA
jgi:diguanylate cyclase (GGDEF)-like protein